MKRKLLRCAIYTRKSTEEGLEQGFNSLDAQREACAAYIASQKGEGWNLLPDRYDDGAISGGTLNRPALKRLLANIKAGEIDHIVVYKVDRLTRSLTDFAKLVDQFDCAGASFVSVTQQFNTSTSMGRLTLNVLLSFAQFEREVTSERIRDKIAASKEKGIWMGGPVPLGYDARDRRLVINEVEAETVRTLFRLYLELGCVRRVKEEADDRGLVTKVHYKENGTCYGGGEFSRGRIYHLLKNPLYAGYIRHKERCYPGQQASIIDKSLFEDVRLKLDKGRKRVGYRNTVPSSLAGKFVDETGDRLIPTHTTRRGKRYRYYVSRRLITESGKSGLGGWRLPALAFEKSVARLIVDGHKPRTASSCQRFQTLASLQSFLSARDALFETLNGPDHHTFLNSLVLSGSIRPGRLSVKLCPVAIADKLDITPGQLDQDTLIFESNFKLHRNGTATKLVLGEPATAVDHTLLRTVAQGWTWFEAIKAGATMGSIAKAHSVTQRRVAHLVDLAFLAPDIVQSIVDGRHPQNLTADRLVKSKHHCLWSDQRVLVESF